MHPLVRTLLRCGAAGIAPLALGLVIASGFPASAATSSGTTISNTATATYSDGVNTYNSQSNTVTTTVQNAPSLTIAPPSGTPGNQPVSPGGTVTDTYTLTNTGNGPGYFALTGVQNTDDGVTAGQGTFTTYVVNAGAGNQTLGTIAAVNNYLLTGNAGGPFLTAVAGTITIGVTYSGNVGASGTITTKLTPDITMPGAGSGGPANTTTQVSATVLGQYNDTVVVDARIDVQKIATPGGTIALPTVSYTVRFANGGSRNLAPVFKNALPGGNAAAYSGCANSTACGVVFTDKLPSYNATQLTLNGTPSISGATGTIIYSTDGTTWTTTIAGAVYVGVFLPTTSITGAGLTTFQPNTSASSQNSVTAGQASLTLSFTINGSTAFGAGNPNAITNVANSTYADQSGFIEGPGIAVQSVTNNAASTTAQAAPAIANANGALTGSGSIASPATLLNTVLLNGPNGFPGAVGPTSNNDDYTASSYTNGGAILAAVNGFTVAVPAGAAAITIVNSLQNNGNKDDTYNLTAATGPGLTALPAGWTATFASAGQGASGACGAVVAGTVITSVCVPSGSTVNYRTIYTPPAGATSFTAFGAYGDAITATSVNDNTKNNVTIDEIFVGGFVKLQKTWSVALGQPCLTASVYTASSPNASPGDCIQFTVTYTNVAPTGGTNDITLNATTFVITEDGTVSGGTTTPYTNSWFTSTNGLYAAPVDSNGGTLGAYNPGPGAAGSSKFTDTIASLVAGASGNVSFKVQVK